MKANKLSATGWLVEIRDHGMINGIDVAPPRPESIADAMRYLERADDGTWSVDPCTNGSITLTNWMGDGSRRLYEFEGGGFCTVLELVGPNWQQIGYFPV
jgi:hypothetical protein